MEQNRIRHLEYLIDNEKKKNSMLEQWLYLYQMTGIDAIGYVSSHITNIIKEKNWQYIVILAEQNLIIQY